MSLIEDVRQFHEKFGVPMHQVPTVLKREDWEYRAKFLQEELQETLDAYEDGDHDNVADGLIDLVYVALGTLLLMGVPVQAAWDEVQRANMSKERVKADLVGSKRGHAWDVVKPPGWIGPRWEQIVPEWKRDQ